MSRSTISNSSVKLAIVVLVVCTLCNSNGVNGFPVPKIQTTQNIDCRGNLYHHCTNYKALLVNVYSEAPTKVVTFRGNETELKNITRHPISVYHLYRERRVDLSSQLRYWKTIGDKYLAVNSKGHLTLEEGKSTRFLTANATITASRVETFYVCAIKGRKSYLVTHSRNMESNHELTEADCLNKSTLIAKLDKIKPGKRKKYMFNGVGVKDTNFNSLDITIGDELKLLCDV